MLKKYYRYFFGFLEIQERWLNKMSAAGYRLISTGRLQYQFETCRPDEIQYRIEFIGGKSRQSAQEYRNFLEGLGYTVFYKNINLNYSLGKVKYRPWADKGGRFATNATTFNRELLIVGKPNDGKPFELHTTFEDKAQYYQTIRRPWLCSFLFFALFGILLRILLFGAAALLSLIPVIVYQIQIGKNKRAASIQEN